MNRYDQHILTLAPAGAEIRELSMAERPTGWKGWLSDALPFPIFGWRTMTRAAGAYYLVGEGESWQLCTLAKDLTPTWVDVTDALARATSRKSFVHDGLTYMVARRVR